MEESGNQWQGNPHESFMKLTAHEFKNQIGKTNIQKDQFMVNKVDRKDPFWQQNALPWKFSVKRCWSKN